LNPTIENIVNYLGFRIVATDKIDSTAITLFNYTYARNNQAEFFAKTSELLNEITKHYKYVSVTSTNFNELTSTAKITIKMGDNSDDFN
jgi:hypothetical protein